MEGNGPLPSPADAILHLEDAHAALELVAALRWPDGVWCPHCSSRELSLLKSRHIWKCRARRCRKQFSVRIGTILEDSPISLQRWLSCLGAIANDEAGIRSRRLARALGVSQKSAWFMLHRVRLAIQTPAFAAHGDPRERVPVADDVPASLERLKAFAARILAVPKVEIDQKAQEWGGRCAALPRGAGGRGTRERRGSWTAFKALNEGGRDEK